MIRPAIVAVLLCSVVGPARAGEDERDKLTNDRPDRPLQMPPASSEAKEAFDDFDRFVRRGAWERATKAIDSIPDAQAARFVDAPDGFMVTVASKRRSSLAGLPPEGQAAYRLFHDDEARKLLEGAEGPTEQTTLERVYSRYFLTSVGDDAADRLGDLYFERGDFDRAADCWLALLRERPDTDLAPAAVATKAAFALARAGRKLELDSLGREVGERYAGEVVALGGRKAPAADHLRRAQAEARGGSAGQGTPAAGSPPELADPVEPAWQLRFGASVMAGMSPAETAQWEGNPLQVAVPRAAVEGGTLYANYLGHLFAVDLLGGKMLWRSASFHNLDLAAMQNQARMTDPNRYGIVAGGGLVVALGRDLRDPNFQAPFTLTCRRAEGGDVVWKSADFPDFAAVDLVGQPILARGTLYIAARTGATQQQNQPDQFVLAIRPRDGKLLWKAEVGTFRQGRQMYSYYGMADTTPQPRLACRGGSVYVDTHAGVLARLDADSGRVDWGYGYETEATQSGGRFFFSRMGNEEPTSAPGSPVEAGEALLVKGSKAEPDLRHRSRPPETALGPAGRQDGPPARRRRGPHLPRRARARGPRRQNPAAPVVDPPARRVRGRLGDRPGGRDLAVHPPRGLRGRPRLGPGPADLPGERPRSVGRRPPPDRPLGPGDQQPDDLGLPAWVGGGPGRRRRPGDPPFEGLG